MTVQEPDFSSYTLDELLDAYDCLNKNKWPERAKKIALLIAERQKEPQPSQSKIKLDKSSLFLLGGCLVVFLIVGRIGVGKKGSGIYFSFDEQPIGYSITFFIFVWFFLKLLMTYFSNDDDSK